MADVHIISSGAGGRADVLTSRPGRFLREEAMVKTRVWGALVLCLVAGSALEAGAATTTPAAPKPAALPALKWASDLDAGLKQAKTKSQPVLVLFTTKTFKGLPNFDDKDVRKALTDSGAVLVKILPPEAAKPAKGATADDIKKQQDAFADAQTKYKDLCAKYSVTATPTIVFFDADGDAVSTLATPTNDQLVQALNGLAKTIEAFKAAKAKADPAKPADKPAEPKKD
jgi:hypothetical protein